MTSRTTFRNWVVYSLRIRRVEYRIAELPIFLMPVLLTIDELSSFNSPGFWEGLLVFFFLFAFGDLVNCLADRDLDAHYKPQLTEAVYGLGVRGVIIQSVVSAAAAILISLHLAWLLNRPLLVPLVICGVLLAWAYSVEPVRLKGRGLWQLVFYWLGLFAGPMIFVAAIFAWPIAVEVILFSLAFGLLQTGVILVNTAEDFPEDRELGVCTVIVYTGIRNGMRLALILTVIGWGVLLVSVAWIGLRGDADGWSMLVATAPLLAAGIAVGVSLLRLVLRMPPGETDEITLVKRTARLVPVWMTACALTSLWACGVLFWLRTHTLASLPERPVLVGVRESACDTRCRVVVEVNQQPDFKVNERESS